MVTFTIHEDNHITAFAGAQEAAQTRDATATSFDSQAALAKVSAAWPLSRFVEIWNSVPGNLKVKKFSDLEGVQLLRGSSSNGRTCPRALLHMVALSWSPDGK
jgi:hypothetical protein